MVCAGEGRFPYDELGTKPLLFGDYVRDQIVHYGNFGTNYPMYQGEGVEFDNSVPGGFEHTARGVLDAQIRSYLTRSGRCPENKDCEFDTW
jgi:hypothetical protein